MKYFDITILAETPNTFNIISIWISQFYPTWIKRQILLVNQTISCYSTARSSIVSERHGIKGFNGTGSEQSWCPLLNASMGTLANSAIPHLHEKPINSTHHSVSFLSGPVISLYSPGRRNSILKYSIPPPKKNISTNVFPSSSSNWFCMINPELRWIFPLPN